MPEMHFDTLAHLRRDLVVPSTKESTSRAPASTRTRFAFSMYRETGSRSQPTKGGSQCWRRSVRLLTTRSCS